MKKRMIFAATVLSIGLMATPISAEDVTAGLDLDSMSVEDLVLLRDAVNQKIGEKGGDNIIGEGIFEVGVDIKAGHYKVCGASDYEGYTTLETYANMDDCKNQENEIESLDLYGSEEGYDKGNLSLKDGQFLLIWRGSAVIEEIDASWAPEE